ncbi:hypothetical protein BS329_16990 [Amycolatopsis coloradensis]|uniref:AB hydrolase-1 domain-containing protein n=1 Tax=Amycolatopsis coloradensis TaxID=76021 RepID=A0A1R0KTX4_9PSEU|nr:alpha/beta hydrolase [Amycolatopsis coloradensis]OLZ51476.1 hypothetical protein BS329_16990 [Amycolatopsis coloradensis]
MSSRLPPSPLHTGGQGKSLLLLHGLGSAWRTWEPILPMLERDFFVVAPTVPGHWGALPLRPAYQATPQSDADEVENWLDHFGLDRVAVVGHSLGAWTALELARRGRCETVVLLTPAGAWRSRADLVKVLVRSAAGHAVARLMAPFAPQLMRLLPVRRAYFDFLVRDGRHIDVPDAVLELRAAAYCSAMIAALYALARAELMRPWHEHENPVHVVLAQKDRVLPFEQFEAPLLELVEPVEWLMLPDTGHLVHRDAPRQVAEIIRGAVLDGRMPKVDVRQDGRGRQLRSVSAADLG